MLSFDPKNKIEIGKVLLILGKLKTLDIKESILYLIQKQFDNVISSKGFAVGNNG